MSPSIWQILIVLVIVMLLFGPKRISGLGKSLGEAIRGFKKGLNDEEIDVTESTRKERIAEDQNTRQEQKQKTEEKEKV